MKGMPRHRPGARRAAHGQVLVIFALASLVLLGALGLAIDGGYDYIQRRGMQNAADAAALAGARAISQNQTNTQVRQAVLDAAAHNGVTDATKVTCTFITNAYDPITNTLGTTQDCAAGTAGVAMSTFTANYTGVLVGTTERHQTFFFRALGVAQSGASATAAARVERPIGVTGGPFMVCGVDTTVTNASAVYQGGIYQTNGTYPTTRDSNNKPTINRVDGYDPCSKDFCKVVVNDASGAPVVDEGAYALAGAGLVPIPKGNKEGPTYLIHAPKGNSVCNDNSASFNGINTNVITYDSLWYRAYLANDPTLNNTWPGIKWPPLTTGTVASISATVNGINGCKAGGVVDKCVMILPVCDNSGPGGTGSGAILAVRSLEAFYIEESSNNSHTAKLIKGYNIQANSDPTFITGSGGITAVKLVK